MKYNLLIFALCPFLLNCQNKKSNNPASNQLIKNDSEEIAKPSKKYDDRLFIYGDFNGDGIRDTLNESYISLHTHQETGKILFSGDWESNQELIIKNKPITRIYSSIKNIDTFTITTEHQQTGLDHFRNLGDLNDDGGDEFGFVINWLSNSNLNTFFIYTIDKNKFKKVLSFQINEMIFYEGFDDLFENGSFIQKAPNNSFEYKFFSDSATFETGKYPFQ